MNKKIIYLVFFVSLISFTLHAQKPTFKIIAYSTAAAKIDSIPYQYLTHINYSFAIPAKTGDTLEPLKNVDYVKLLIEKAKKHNVKVFLSIGGWGIGDGGGDDTRFHKMAETETGQKTFVASCMKMVQYFGFDGIDFDWEYPDPDHRSAQDFTSLCKKLNYALKAVGKDLTAAVVSSGKQAYGVEEEVYQYFDWLNIMSYDGDYGPKELKHHAPYSMAVSNIEFWLNERKLPLEKCILGLPFYAKKGFGNYGFDYKKLLKEGASPYDDYWNGHFYNGLFTITNKTKYALDKKLGGVMVWEMSCDTNDEYSLFRRIYEVVTNKK
jgi:GH18 family chitinase